MSYSGKTSEVNVSSLSPTHNTPRKHLDIYLAALTLRYLHHCPIASLVITKLLGDEIYQRKFSFY